MYHHKPEGPLAHLNGSLTKAAHRSQVLHNARIERINFDPTNFDHRVALAEFLTTGRWLIQFHVELPCTSIVQTAEKKFIKHALELEFGVAADRRKSDLERALEIWPNQIEHHEKLAVAKREQHSHRRAA